MSLNEALTKALREYDAIAERVLRDCELLYVDLGADDEELAAGLARERRTVAKGRMQIHEAVRAAYSVGLDAPSIRVH